MHRIDGPGAGPGNSFVSGNPGQGIPATTVTARFMQAVQEEIAKVIEIGGGLVLDPDDNGQLLASILQLTGGGGASGGGLGNQIINGDMSVFQRALTAPGGILTMIDVGNVATYALDRWQGISPGPGKVTFTRQPHTPGQTVVPGNPSWFMRAACTTACNATPYVRTNLEDVSRYSGGQFTWSVYSKAAANTAATMRIVQYFGSGGSADVVLGTLAHTIGTAFTRQSLTVTLTSVSGKTFGAGHCLRLECLLPTGSTWTVDFSDAQGEYNSAATPFQRRPPQVEFDLCQRYFEKSWSPDTAASTAPTSTDGASVGTSALTGAPARTLGRRFRVPKRASPTMVWFDTVAQAANQIEHNGATSAVTGTADAGPGSTGYPTISGTYSPAETVSAHWTADAEL